MPAAAASLLTSLPPSAPAARMTKVADQWPRDVGRAAPAGPPGAAAFHDVCLSSYTALSLVGGTVETTLQAAAEVA